jgi:lysophospholipid acyltransferase (LPLAT)-like uncharacterized protein
MEKLMKQTGKFIFLILSLLLLSSCAEAMTFKEAANAEKLGFLYGLWHGLISPIAFISSLFMDNVAIYAINNTGGWYNFGFMFGVCTIFGGGSKSTCR